LAQTQGPYHTGQKNPRMENCLCIMHHKVGVN